MTNSKISRRDIILQTLAQMLESYPGQAITTAALAKAVGVSEAALYRHFPSKAKMFEALIEFIEDTLFSRINLILKEESGVLIRCEQILHLLLTFTSKNPGLCRILTGDALTGEHERLRIRAAQVFERLETQLKQVMRHAEIQEELFVSQSINATANLLLAWAQGRISQFVLSEFKKPPNQMWQEQWSILSARLFRSEKFAQFSE